MAFSLSLGLTALWFLFMTWLSHQNGEDTSKTSRELAEKLSFLQEDEETLNYRLRCAAHVVTYLILVLLLGVTLELGGLPYWPLGAVLVWSWVDEATKPLVRGRHFSWRDVGLNWLGCGLGFAFLWLCR